MYYGVVHLSPASFLFFYSQCTHFNFWNWQITAICEGVQLRQSFPPSSFYTSCATFVLKEMRYVLNNYMYRHSFIAFTFVDFITIMCISVSHSVSFHHFKGIYVSLYTYSSMYSSMPMMSILAEHPNVSCRFKISVTILLYIQLERNNTIKYCSVELDKMSAGIYGWWQYRRKE